MGGPHKICWPAHCKNLSWAKYIGEISKKISAIGALKRIRPFIETCTAVKTYSSLIEPHFHYCSPVWDGMALLTGWFENKK